MEQTRFDIVVIGGGTGGYVAAIRAAQLGLKTALVEREKVGGICLHKGCIPTKVLLHSADIYNLLQKAEDFGFMLDQKSLTYDYPKIRAKVDKVVSQLYRGVEFLLKKNKVTVFKGQAVIENPAKISVHTYNPSEPTSEVIAELSATNILLSTGSRWRTLPNLPTNHNHTLLDGYEALNLITMPKTIAIVGAGQTGVEFASFYRSFGVDVHLIEAEARLLPAEDQEISTQLDRLFSRRGIHLYLNTRLETTQIVLNEGGAQINLTVKEKPKPIQVEKVLLALGRLPNISGLEALNLKLNTAGFVQTDQNLQAAPHVYAIGDLMGGFSFERDHTNSYMLAHTSSAQGIFVAELLAGQNPDPVNYASIPRCTYSSPQVASLGLNEAQARAKAKTEGRDPQTAVKVGKFSFKANGRALMLGESEGFVKIVSDAENNDLLGVHITGPTATELIGSPALAKLFDGTAWELAQATQPHPALAEVIMEAARDVDGWAIHQ
jgi:dihydrolipoamide dehydrogenase